MSDDLKTIRRQLKIKSGVVKRQVKELNLYRQEEQDQVVKVNKLKADGADPADVRHAETVLREAEKMVPDAQGRTAKAVADLRDLTTEATAIPEMVEDPDLLNAKIVLEEAAM